MARSNVGTFCRDRTSPAGRSVFSRIVFHAKTVSFASAGRTMSRCGMFRSDHRCSTGWCVGPSSPRPIESCVQTNVEGISISAASRTAPRM